MKKQRILVFVFLFVFASLLYFGFNVKATSNTNTLITVQGAQVRTTGSAGIRFVGKIDASFDKTNVTAYGLSIAFGEIDVDKIEVGGTVNGKSVLSAQVSEVTESNNFYINLTNIPNTMFGQDVTARAYVVRNGEIEYADTAATRNLGEVALAVKAAGQTSDLITSVINTLTTDYKAVYTDANGNIFVGSSVYEIKPENLEKEFVKDWNAKFGTEWTEVTISEMVNSAATGYSANTDKDPSLGNLYKFFRDTENGYEAKWLWLLEYIASFTGVAWPCRQANAIINYDKTNGTTDNTYDLYKDIHLATSISNFFNRVNETKGYSGVNFDNVSRYATLDSYNDVILAANPTLVAYNNTINLPEITKEGYTFKGYTGSVLHEGTYTVTATSEILVPTYTANEYTITYYNGNEEVTALAGTYTIEDEVTLPELSLDGYDFLGWYDNSSFTGSVVTTISKGTTGTKVYYAKLQEAEFANLNVTYDVNGGLIAAADIDPINSFIVEKQVNWNSDDKTYMATSATTLTFQYKFALSYDSTLDLYKVVAVDAAKNALNTLGVEYTHAIANVSVNITTYASVGQYIKIDIAALQTGTPQTAYVYDLSYQNGFSTVLKEPVTLPTPTRDGYIFKGWLSSVDSSVVTTFPGYTINPGNITYTAQWGSAEEGVYTITYKYEDGTIITGLTPTSYSTETNGSIDLPDAPTKDGYEFLGWYDGSEKVATFFASDAEDKVFVAKYQSTGEEAKYSIPNDMTHLIKALVTLENGYILPDFTGLTGLPSQSKTAYTWTSLNTDIVTISTYSTLFPVSSGYAIIRGEYTANSSAILYAVIKVVGSEIYISSLEEANTPVYYTVTFTDESGKTIATQSVKEGDAATLPTPPAKSGYTFYGWSTDHYPITTNITLEPTYIKGTSDFVGKKVSILGDSISTYKGYIPEGYKYFYPDPASKLNGYNDTWWMQVINKLGMNLLKNNSWAGSCVSSGTGNGATVNDSRLAELLDGTTKPDIILLFMGSNDCGSQYVELSTFTSSYKIMLDKMIALCPNAEIYIMTLPPSKLYTESDRIEYNKVITNYANSYGLPLINMDNVYNGENVSNYLVDSAHLNLAGMDKFAELVVANLLSNAGIN